MKLTTLIACSVLIAFGILAAVYALSGFDLLLFLCAGNRIVYRCLLSLAGIGSLWLLFWLIAFRPTKPLS